MIVRLVPQLVTLNDLQWRNGRYFTLRYFTEFGYHVVVKQLPRFQSLLCIVYDHINTICAVIQRLFGQNKL